MEKATFIWQVSRGLNEVKYWGIQFALNTLILGIYFKNTTVFKASLIHMNTLFCLPVYNIKKNVAKTKYVFSLFSISV